ncbi:hypothetical protein LBWT_X3520 (plasmid) [Leptolyngbya boryana IAM M-101]|nr:hypothetical protein LBWT_X3520 [Leptolyngbya boryana IAM M-101]BAS66628.1 hypothetical protein LBDG_X3520 [Leptolyngbya boryana dg5]
MIYCICHSSLFLFAIADSDSQQLCKQAAPETNAVDES